MNNELVCPICLTAHCEHCKCDKCSSHWPRMVVNREISGELIYTVCKTFKEANQTSGKMIGTFPLDHYIKNEKRIQDYLKEKHG